MHNRPYFSIIIPTYNRQDYIALAIYSVLQQEFKLFEIIVVDDGSIDNTERVVKNIQDPRITYYKKINGERAAARNFGIKKASGEFITFLDSDDLLKPNHFLIAKSFIEKNSPAIFHMGYDVIGSSGELIYPWKPLPSPTNIKLLDGNYLSCLGIFIKQEVFSLQTFNEDRDLSGSEDYELWLRLASRYDILACPTSTAQLVNHDARSVIQIDPKSLIKRINLLRFYLNNDQIFVSTFSGSLKKWNAYLDIYIALHLALVNLRKKSLCFAIKSISKFPPVIFSKRLWAIPKKLIFH
jgi:glycosyltransferase involved in cell wall biosynthesis